MASTVKVGITAEDEGFGQSLQQMASEASKFAKEVGVSGKGVAGLTKSFRTAKKAAMDLSLAYSQLSDEAKNSDFGRAMKEQLDKAKEAASQLLDMKGDISQELSNMASDTATWDSLSQGIDVVGTSATALIGIFSDVNGESEAAAETLKTMATVQSSLNAVISIGNALQKQSSLMKGISIVQSKAATLAKTMETKATIGATVAQRAFNAVANANPYVLLATAVLAVGSAIVAFAKDSAKAKAEEEKMKKATEEAEEAEKRYAQNVAQGAAETSVKLSALRKELEGAGQDTEKKKEICDRYKETIDLCGGSVDNLTGSEVDYDNEFGRMQNSLIKRAIAMAKYQEAIELAKRQLQALANAETRQAQMAALSTSKTYTREEAKKIGFDYFTEKKGKTWVQPTDAPGYYQEYTIGYELSEKSKEKAIADAKAEGQKIADNLQSEIRKKLTIGNEYLADATGTTPKKTTPKKTTPKKTTPTKKTSSNGGKKEEEQKTAVERLNKELEAEKKKLENINKENDKDGTKKKAVYETMLKINKQLENYYDVDDTGFDKLKGILQDELKLVEANSDEWNKIQDKIKKVNYERINVALEKGNDGLEESLALLRENRNLVAQDSDEWNELTKQITEIEEHLAKMNVDHIKGSLGYIQDLISGLEDIKMNLDINTKEGMKRLIEITNEIAAMTSEQQIIDIYVNTFSFDNFVTQYDALLEKFKDNEDITLIIKTQLADNAKGQITALNEMLSSGLIDFDKFKSQIDDLFKYLEDHDIDTTNITKELVDGISGAINGQNDLLSLGLIDTSTFVENISKMKQQLVDLGVSGEAAMRALNTSGVQALSDLQSKYNEGIIDKDEFLKQFEALKQQLVDLGLDIKIKPELETSKWEKDLNSAADAVNSLGSAFSSLGELSEDPTLKIAGIIAQSIANIALGAGKAISKAGELGPWGWLAFGTSIMAQMAAMIAQIHSATGYAEGGIIKGSTTIGDHLIARVNAGEAILNTRQQARLFDMIDHGQMYNNVEPQVSTVRIKGSDIYLSLKNYSKISGKTSFGNGINTH